jgi:hypothetical protein
LCMTSNPMDENPSKLPSPSICACQHSWVRASRRRILT